MKTFYLKPGIVEALSDFSSKTMLITWLNFRDDEAMVECCEAQIAQLELGIQVAILDTREAKGVPSQMRQKWFETSLYPTLGEKGLKAVITVLPKSAITLLASKRWIKNGSQFNFDSFEANSLTTALELAEDIVSGKGVPN